MLLILIEVGLIAFTEDYIKSLQKRVLPRELDRQICANNLDMTIDVNNERIKANLRKAERVEAESFFLVTMRDRRREFTMYHYHAMSTIRVSPHLWS